MSAKKIRQSFFGLSMNYGKETPRFIDEVCSPTFTFHSPNYPEWPSGLEGARQIVAYGAKLYREGRSKIEDIIAEEDKLAVRWTITGIYIDAAKPDSPAPGETVTVGAMSMYRFVDGKIEEDWGTEVFWPSGTSDVAILGWSPKR